MTEKKKRDRSERPTIGKINCPAGHAASVKRQAAGRKLYYIHCPKCGGITASGQGWQDYILENANFNNPAVKDEPTKPAPKEKEIETPEETKRPFFANDDDLGF